MDNVELMKADLRKRVEQIEYIRQKVGRISGRGEFSTIRLFEHKLETVRKRYEAALTPAGWQSSYASITKSDRLTQSLIVGRRLEVFTFEVNFELMAIRYDSGFFGFWHPDRFNLFGLDFELVYNQGSSGGVRVPRYDAVRSAIQEDPSMIPRERERVTEYIMRGCQTCVFKRNGESFPIDLTIPYGY